SKWITSPASRREGHTLRAQVDAIAIGANTVRQDNPSLTAHGLGRNPVRIVFAGRRPLPKRAKIFNRAAPTWVLRARGPKALGQVLANLAERGITHLLVEGGASLQRSFLEAGLIDEVVWFVAPIIIGQAKRLRDARRLQSLRINPFGKDVCIR